MAPSSWLVDQVGRDNFSIPHDDANAAARVVGMRSLPVVDLRIWITRFAPNRRGLLNCAQYDVDGVQFVMSLLYVMAKLSFSQNHGAILRVKNLKLFVCHCSWARIQSALGKRFEQRLRVFNFQRDLTRR